MAWLLCRDESRPKAKTIAIHCAAGERQQKRPKKHMEMKMSAIVKWVRARTQEPSWEQTMGARGKWGMEKAKPTKKMKSLSRKITLSYHILPACVALPDMVIAVLPASTLSAFWCSTTSTSTRHDPIRAWHYYFVENQKEKKRNIIRLSLCRVHLLACRNARRLRVFRFRLLCVAFVPLSVMLRRNPRFFNPNERGMK